MDVSSSSRPFKRIFYKEHPRVEERSWEEIDKFLNLHQIKFSGFDLPKPVLMLDEINFPDYIANELKMQGISRPTAIQSMIWPALYSGRDIMCIGLPCYSRVLSYICPALVFIKEQEYEKRKKGPLVLIVTQTKEVAKEILTHSSMFIYQSQCSFCSLIDDENINTQIALLNERDHDIIIGNYHRLCELMDNDLVNLKNVSYLIMDDFYRNRSARLSDEIKRVVNETNTDRQTAIFSRIVPSGLQKSNGDEFQRDALFVCIGNDDIHVSHKDLPQEIHICTMAEKKKKLQDIITEISEREKNFKILVYANGFKKIRITEKIIKEQGIDTFAYERTNVGRRRRAMKEKVYYNFNATPNSVLVASDVVSSKVELPDLNYIINADFPVNLSLYLNRMRMSNVKKYISLFIAEDARHADRLIYVLNECRQTVPSILYKISEAYINSGKDVDRMPSLQEINEGLTKPVEKPIPKPLPPTVSLESSSTSKAKRSIDENLKVKSATGAESSSTPEPTEANLSALFNSTEMQDKSANSSSSNLTVVNPSLSSSPSASPPCNNNNTDADVDAATSMVQAISSALSPSENSSTSSSLSSATSASVSSANANKGSSSVSSSSSSILSSSNSSTSSSSSSFKRFKSNHRSFPPPPSATPSSQQQQQAAYYHQHSAAAPTPMYSTGAAAYYHHQQQTAHGSQFMHYPPPPPTTVPPPMSAYNYQTTASQPYYSSYHLMANNAYYTAANPNAAAAAAAAVAQQQQQLAYQQLLNGQSQQYLNMNGYRHQSMIPQQTYHLQQQQQQQFIQQQQQQQQWQQQLQQQSQMDTNGQHGQMANEVSYKTAPAANAPTAAVKAEPMEPEQYKTAHSDTTPYFTNPMAFKQEPADPATSSAANPSSTPPSTSNSGPANGSSGQDGNNSDALSIVSQLLKDKQILNQLEKVAQTFRHPTASVYQGSWNFQ